MAQFLKRSIFGELLDLAQIKKCLWSQDLRKAKLILNKYTLGKSGHAF